MFPSSGADYCLLLPVLKGRQLRKEKSCRPVLSGQLNIIVRGSIFLFRILVSLSPSVRFHYYHFLVTSTEEGFLSIYTPKWVGGLSEGTPQGASSWRAALTALLRDGVHPSLTASPSVHEISVINISVRFQPDRRLKEAMNQLLYPTHGS